MNQRDATVTVLSFFQEHPSGCEAVACDKTLSRAVKVLTKRAETLRLRNERRFAKVPIDIMDEPLTLSEVEILTDLAGKVCRPCGRGKAARESVCPKCWARLDGGLQKSLWRRELYPWAFCRAVRILTPPSL